MVRNSKGQGAPLINRPRESWAVGPLACSADQRCVRAGALGSRRQPYVVDPASRASLVITHWPASHLRCRPTSDRSQRRGGEEATLEAEEERRAPSVRPSAFGARACPVGRNRRDTQVSCVHPLQHRRISRRSQTRFQAFPFGSLSRACVDTDRGTQQDSQFNAN